MSDHLAQIERFLAVLVEPGTVFEIRAPKCRERPGASYTSTASGYFTHATIPEAAAEAARLDAAGVAPGIYVTLNPVLPDLVARAANRVERRASATTGDHEVVRRRRLLIDCDPVRAAGISSSDEELALVKASIEAVRADLDGLGWPAPLVAMSGNGYHLVYAIDLPTDDGGLVKRVLAALAARHDDARVKIDTSVHNAARITKLIGTVARKGDPVAGVSGVADRPHRRSFIVECPDRLETVPAELLEALATTGIPPAGPRLQPKPARTGGMFDRFESSPDGVAGYLAKHGVAIKGRKVSGDTVWLLLEGCPVVPTCVSTGESDIAVGIKSSGVICYVNQHNRGQHLKWRDVREVLEPGYADFAGAQPGEDAVYPRAAAAPPTSLAASPVQEPVQERAEEAAKGWPDPQPLPNLLPPVPAFDPSWLPGIVRGWVEDVAERVQCPVDFVAAGVFVSLGSVLGRSIAIRPKRLDDWQIVPNIWGGVVGPPSVMKSPALSEAMRPLSHLELRARKEHQEAAKQSAADEALAKIRADVAKSDVRAALRDGRQDVAELIEKVVNAEVERPVRQRFIVQDPTVEKLGELLNENPRGLLLFRDELTGFLRSLDKDGRENDRAFYLEAWNGVGHYTYDRIGRGTIDIDACCVSVLGGIQPGPFVSYLGSRARRGAGDDGFVQRFQFLVWPDISAEWRLVDRWPDTPSRLAAAELYQRLAAANRFDIDAETDENDERRIPFLRFDEQAQERFNHWWTDHEKRVRSGDMPEAVQAHLTKYRKLVPALALISHLADGGSGSVPLGPLERAIGLAVYLEGHSARTYAGVLLTDVQAARLIGRRLATGQLPPVFAARDVYRMGWSGLTDVEEVEAGLEVLADLGWLRGFTEAPKGKGRSRYEVNPKVARMDSGATDKADKCPFVGDVGTPGSEPGGSGGPEEDSQWQV